MHVDEVATSTFSVTSSTSCSSQLMHLQLHHEPPTVSLTLSPRTSRSCGTKIDQISLAWDPTMVMTWTSLRLLVWWPRGSSLTRVPGVEGRACRMMRAPSCQATHHGFL